MKATNSRLKLFEALLDECGLHWRKPCGCRAGFHGPTNPPNADPLNTFTREFDRSRVMERTTRTVEFLIQSYRCLDCGETFEKTLGPVTNRFPEHRRLNPRQF